MMDQKIVDRFWAKVDRRTDYECWKWLGSTDSCGYGRLNINQKLEGAHRLSWEMANGEIEYGMCVLHKCDCPACVNPNHLFLGTHTDNMRDMTNKGRHAKITNVPHRKYFDLPKSVRFDKNNKTNPYYVRFQYDKKSIYVGCFPSPDLASKAYKHAISTFICQHNQS